MIPYSVRNNLFGIIVSFLIFSIILVHVLEVKRKSLSDVKELLWNPEEHLELSEITARDELVPTEETDIKEAETCNKSTCFLPSCYCSLRNSAVPGGFQAEKVPQMITLTFDDTATEGIIKLLNGRHKNPNGCTIKATFFLCHSVMNYSMAQQLHHAGHEIAVHSLTHNPNRNYWIDASPDSWKNQMSGTRHLLKRFANISESEVTGLRVPFLATGGDTQFKMMENEGFSYDSSITTPFKHPPTWPYTLHHKITHPCASGQNCPKQSHPIWEMVMNRMGRKCTLDCSREESDSEGSPDQKFYDYLETNFKKHYEYNRAPFGIFRHWENLDSKPAALEVLMKWIDDTLTKHNDVYFVTMAQVVEWMRNPNPSASIKDFEPWKNKCSSEIVPVCPQINVCTVQFSKNPSKIKEFHTCFKCPKFFPWIDDLEGEGE